jgi:Rrf2 family protein
MLSQKAKYALRALLVLAARPGDEPVHIADIAESEHISRKFLEATLLELRKRGVLTSQRGQRGGYRLARQASEISFGEVIRVIDGPLAPLPCASVTAFRLCSDCANPHDCSIRWLMQKVRDAIAGVLDECTLAEALGKRPVAHKAINLGKGGSKIGAARRESTPPRAAATAIGRPRPLRGGQGAIEPSMRRRTSGGR